MLKITCFNCHLSWSLNPEATQAALDSLKEDESYYAIECPKCRRVNKIPIKQIKRSLPRARD
jgi:phage FluMu protein Com